VENQADCGQHVRDAPLDLEASLQMPKDEDEDGDQGHVYLGLHGVMARAKEALDFEVLLYELKESLNLPS
jgi:hypothetical protein